jgi:hypothetical protein
MVEITDEDSSRAWLETQPQEVVVAFAVRCALWAFPVLGRADDEALAEIALPVLRAMLTSGVAAVGPTPDVRRASRAAAEGSADTAYIAYAAQADSAYATATIAAQIAAGDAAKDSAANAAIIAVDANTDVAVSVRPYGTGAYGTGPYGADTDARSTVWRAISSDATTFEGEAGLIFTINTPVWPEAWAVKPLAEPMDKLRTFWAADPGVWDFWRDWYDGMLAGTPMDWALQEAVALIPDGIWDAGPAAVAAEIERIRAEFQGGVAADQPEIAIGPVSAEVRLAVQQRVAVNRDALAVSIASLQEQIANERERVRGLNSLDVEVRDRLLAVLDEMSDQLGQLKDLLPVPGEDLSDDKTDGIVHWLRAFKLLLRAKAVAYVSPENVAEAAVPTCIILGCTAVGSMLGMPLAGAAVGGLLTNQLKPGAAAKDLLKSETPVGD